MYISGTLHGSTTATCSYNHIVQTLLTPYVYAMFTNFNEYCAVAVISDGESGGVYPAGPSQHSWRAQTLVPSADVSTVIVKVNQSAVLAGDGSQLSIH